MEFINPDWAQIKAHKNFYKYFCALSILCPAAFGFYWTQKLKHTKLLKDFYFELFHFCVHFL